MAQRPLACAGRLLVYHFASPPHCCGSSLPLRMTDWCAWLLELSTSAGPACPFSHPPFPARQCGWGTFVGAVLLVAAISPSALAWISFAGSADAAALTLAASASWRLTPETATCGGAEVTLDPKEPVVIAGTSGGTSGTMGVEFRPGAEASEVTRSSCKRRRSEELSSCHAAVLPIKGNSTWVGLIGLAAKFLITVGESFGWSVAVEVETLTGISSGTPRLISGISVARTCVAAASTPEAIPVAEAPGDVGARPAASKSPARKRVTPQKVPITQAAPRPGQEPRL